MGALLCPESAGAQLAKRFTLDYDGPAQCSSRGQVEQRLRALLGEEVAPERPLVARVEVRAVGKALRLVYEARHAETRSHRTLSVDSCEAVTEAAALLLLLTLDPSAAASLGAASGPLASDDTENAQGAPASPATAENAGRTDPAESSVALSAGSSAAPAPAQASADRPATSREGTPSLTKPTQRPPASESDRSSLAAGVWPPTGWLSLSGAALSHVGPSVAWGGTLEAGVAVGGLRLGAGFGYLQAPDVVLVEPEGAQLSAEVLRLRGLVTYLWETGPFRYGPWASLGADRVAARVDGITDPRPGHSTFGSATFGAATSLRLSERWELSARLGAVVPWKRPEFRVAGIAEVLHRPGPVGLDAGVGILWAWSSQ